MNDRHAAKFIYFVVGTAYNYLMKILIWLLLLPLPFLAQTTGLEGGWSTTFPGPDTAENHMVMTVSDGYFVMTAFSEKTREFIATLGGSYETTDSTFDVTYEWDSGNPANVGNSQSIPYSLTGSLLVFNNDKIWRRIDDGRAPLAGAWQITGRERNGEMQRRTPTGPRRTMKLLSNERFQWIAYNTETRELGGTGGGSYTTDEKGNYIESIEFFSRDSTRVGAELPFRYELKEGEWHHSGNSSKGEPIYEVWSRREGDE